MKIVVKASKSAKKRNAIKSNCQSKKKSVNAASFTEDDISVLAEELERIGKGLVYDFTGDATSDVNFIRESEDRYGNPVLIFEVSIGDEGSVLGTVEVGIDLDEEMDEDELTAWFEDEVSSILDDAGVSGM